MAKHNVGQRMKSLKSLKESMKQRKAGLLTFVPKNGEITVRFLEEPEGNWIKYIEHYDQLRRTAFPCIGDDCPGCQDGLRKSDRFLANAVDVERDKSIVMQLPKGLAETLVKYYERNDTLLDRDYILVREGEGLDTSYYPQPEDKFKRKLSKYEVADLDDILDQLVDAYLDEPEDDDEDDDERPVRGKKKSSAAPKKKRRPDPDEDDDDEDDEDEDDEPTPRKKKSKVAPSRKRPDPDEDDDDEDDEDEDEDDEDDDFDEDDEDDDDDDDDDEDDDDDDDEDDDEFYDEEELSAMNVGQLRTIAKEYDIATAGLKKAELIEAILED